jgi:hypothetical protein
VEPWRASFAFAVAHVFCLSHQPIHLNITSSPPSNSRKLAFQLYYDKTTLPPNRANRSHPFLLDGPARPQHVSRAQIRNYRPSDSSIETRCLSVCSRTPFQRQPTKMPSTSPVIRPVFSGESRRSIRDHHTQRNKSWTLRPMGDSYATLFSPT